MRSTLTAALLILTATAAHASSPSLTGVRPLGGQRGTEVEVNLTGARLADAQEVMYYQPGITTAKLQVVNDGHVKVMFKIAPDCRLGLFDIRLRTASGISETRSFSVGALKDVAEVEPNNDFTQPQPIAMNVTVNGIADNEDVDYYLVEAKKGDRISAEVEGIRLGVTLFDPYVAIMDMKRFELASSDDAALVWQDGEASVMAPADGKYVIQVRESAYAGNGACLYRLHVGNFPRPTATVPAGGKLGEAVDVKWIGDVAGEKTTKVTLPPAPQPDFGLSAQDEKGIAPYANVFRLSPYGNVIEAEPNDDQPHATPFTPPMALNGVIGKPDDTDYYVFHAKPGVTYDIRVYARALRSPLDSVLHIAKKGAQYLAGNDDSPGPDSYIRFGVPEDTDYVLWIHDHLKKGGPDYAYRIEVSVVEPKLALSLSPESLIRGTGVVAAAVPRGNRQAILVNAARADFGGDLTITADKLPAGVVFEADTMAANLGTYPVLLTATPEAPIAGSLATLVGKHVDPKVNVPCSFSQSIELVLGQNNIPFWTRTVDTLAVAVTEEAPYSIDIVEPKVPLVRNGSMNLKVVAKRKEGFTAPIAISLPWNPPGVGSAGGIAIPEKQNEAVIPMNAADNAELKTWKIVVNGSSNGPKGPVMVSTQLAKLTVAEKYLTLGFQAASVEQGKEVDMAVKVNKARDFPGEATVTLIGLPNKVTTDVKKITKDMGDVVFHIKTDKVSPAGNHANLFCQVVVTENGEPIVHNLGTGQLRIDVPLPPKPNAPAPAPMPMPVAAAPAPAAAAPPKPLSRLEKLRLENAERAKAASK
ncbi:MAG: peptidase [Isosphaeraceae bacterium]|nr:peptidase [Isosphaeraceae bacterium]